MRVPSTLLLGIEEPGWLERPDGGWVWAGPRDHTKHGERVQLPVRALKCAAPPFAPADVGATARIRFQDEEKRT
jgi:hypothetical protein